MDDDDPPATGGAVVVMDEPEGPMISLAPTAEPNHRVEPNEITAV